ncbi:Receptor-type guanylate cyclase gcy-22, partial [Nowakowskiella sp. JEL0078]
DELLKKIPQPIRLKSILQTGNILQKPTYGEKKFIVSCYKAKSDIPLEIQNLNKRKRNSKVVNENSSEITQSPDSISTLSLTDKQIKAKISKRKIRKQLFNLRKSAEDCSYLAKFVSISLNDQRLYVFWDCPGCQGTLQDVIASLRFRLNPQIAMSIFIDLLCAVNHLHSIPKFGSHGSINSRNCLIDSNWRVQLTGFGLQGLTDCCIPISANIEIDKVFLSMINEKQFCAPEHLTKFPLESGTKEGDIYRYSK